jgi:flagellar hook-length control protein FliK
VPGAPAAAAAATTTTGGTFGEAVQATGQGQPGSIAQQAAAGPAGLRPPVSPQALVDQVKVRIVQNAQSGLDTVRIQLRPDHMGRVDVKMSIVDGRVTAQIVAENREALDILKADSRGLEKALNDAGLATDSNSLSFSLRGDGDGKLARDSRAAGTPYGRPGRTGAVEDDVLADLESLRSTRAAARGGLDIKV